MVPVLPSLKPSLIFPFHLLPYPVHPTGFSFFFFPGFLDIFTLLPSNNNNQYSYAHTHRLHLLHFINLLNFGEKRFAFIYLHNFIFLQLHISICRYEETSVIVMLPWLMGVGFVMCNYYDMSRQYVIIVGHNNSMTQLDDRNHGWKRLISPTNRFPIKNTVYIQFLN